MRSAIAAILLPIAMLGTSFGAPEPVQTHRGLSMIPLSVWKQERDRTGRRAVMLADDWLYCFPATGALYRVPRSYVSDSTSIPPAARGLIAEFGRHAEAAVLHDWLYAVGEPGKRQEADDIFRHAMAQGGVNVVTRNAMHRAIRLFGAGSYGAEREWRNFGQTAPPHTPAEPPFARPDRAAVATVDCSEFDARRSEWIELYRSDRTID